MPSRVSLSALLGTYFYLGIFLYVKVMVVTNRLAPYFREWNPIRDEALAREAAELAAQPEPVAEPDVAYEAPARRSKASAIAAIYTATGVHTGAEPVAAPEPYSGNAPTSHSSGQDAPEAPEVDSGATLTVAAVLARSEAAAKAAARLKRNLKDRQRRQRRRTAVAAREALPDAP